MTLEQFLDAAALCYLTSEEFQKTSSLAGIEWNKLPPLDSVKAVRKYLIKRTEHSHQVSVVECKDEISFLSLTAEPLFIGMDEIELGHKFKSAFQEYSYAQLAAEIAKDPSKGKQILQTFAPDSFHPSESYFASDFMIKYYEEHLNEVQKGVSRVVIQGFEQLSHLIGGFNPQRIIFIEGQTGFGKTNLALLLALNAAKDAVVLYINMEMSLKDMTKRLAVMNSGVTYHDLYRGKIPDMEALKALRDYGHNLIMTPGRSMTMASIEALIRRYHAQGLRFVFIDYDLKIDLPNSKTAPEWKLLQMATIQLEDLAKELDLCIIMLTQQNRDGQNAGSHRATFSAHTVLEFRLDKDWGPVIDAKKNRHGKSDHAVQVDYDKDRARVTERAVIEITHRPEKRH